MPKPTKGARLGSSPAHERKILANLAKSLIEHEAIVTTETKAKRLQPYVEKLITKARKGDIHNRRQVARKIGTQVSKAERELDAVYTLFDVVAPKIDPEREGGYTRIVKMPPRRGDNAPMAQISLVFDKLEKKAKVSKPAAEEKVSEASAE
ncbi:50S ribosomal protein L17 [Nanchangia anserum]|uniref:50S ribosomal protein L17 n=1 Tax=Nanchangia anserum TaxID=2692125 RepID=A0A8I0G7C6_9ACTO|nr:50S ribosomal protein L17 [Nanchangia anserum]MBD3689177.1 50S ribosomal protein L17 [Nanchangia anserum]QOX81405.1 50S ribosomal protein L17 [Nanchangia anserum]